MNEKIKKIILELETYRPRLCLLKVLRKWFVR